MATLIYTTFGTSQDAEAIPLTLLDERLIACANRLPDITSCYRWEGKAQQSTEYPVLLKTSEAASERLIARLNELHPYDTPCILKLPVTGGHPGFLQWIEAETR